MAPGIEGTSQTGRDETMSSILKALKKIERENAEGAQPREDFLPLAASSAADANRPRPVRWFFLPPLLLAAGVGFYLLPRAFRSPPVAVAPTPLPAVVGARLQAELPAPLHTSEKKPASPAVATVSAPEKKQLEAVVAAKPKAPPPQAESAKASRPAVAPAIPTSRPPPSKSPATTPAPPPAAAPRLAEDILRLQAITYDSDPKRRFAVLNNRIVRVGDVEKGYTVRYIANDYLSVQDRDGSFWETRFSPRAD